LTDVLKVRGHVTAGRSGRHDELVELVTRMLDLKKQQARAPKKQSSSDRQLLDQKIAVSDQQIDALVYELYGLNDNEVGTVGGRP
jgi:type II restriction/modification system DNA methylase subunit YeeA